MKAVLTRFWLKLDADTHSPPGYGVTAWTEEDAIAIVRDRVYRGDPVPKPSITPAVDVGKLDPGHIRPNLGGSNWRGIWYPLGFEGDSGER